MSLNRIGEKWQRCPPVLMRTASGRKLVRERLAQLRIERAQVRAINGQLKRAAKKRKPRIMAAQDREDERRAKR